MQVVKRDGRVMEFNEKRIVDAIVKAMQQTKEGVDEELACKIACSIGKQLENRDEVSVYEIQDLVEKKLMVSSRKEVATAYITYRYTRDMARRSKTKNVFLDMIASKSQSSQENSYQSIEKMMYHFAAESIKPYVDTILLSKDVRDAERRGYINIVGKSYYPTKAMMSFEIPYLEEKVLMKERGSIESATTKLLAMVSQVGHEVSHTVSIASVDCTLAPFVKKTAEEELQKVQEDVATFQQEANEEQSQCEALVQHRTQERVHRSLQTFAQLLSFTCEKGKIGTIGCGSENSTEGKMVTNELLMLMPEICQKERECRCEGTYVASRVEMNLPKITSELCTHTKDTNTKLSLGLETNEDELIKDLIPFVEIAIKSLVERFRFQATATKNQFPALMSGLIEEGNELSENDTLESIFRKGMYEMKICGLSEGLKSYFSGNGADETQEKRIVDGMTKLLQKYAGEYHLNFVLQW